MKRQMAQLLLVALINTLAACGSQGGGPPKGAAMPVIVAKAESQNVTQEVFSVGTLAAWERVVLQSEIDGIVEEILFEEGQEVAKGELLFKVDEAKLQASLAEAKANFELASANIKRNEDLFKKKTISRREYDQSVAEYRATKAAVQRLEQDAADARIVAPFPGEMGARLISPGQLVQKGETLSSVVSVVDLKLELSVPERYLAALKKDLNVSVSVSAYPGKKITGTVFFVSPEVDPKTRTVLVKAKVPNQERLLKPGMLANAGIVVEERENAIVIPESALVPQKEKSFVFLVESDDTVSRQEVMLGARLAGEVEIRSGVDLGRLVVIEGVQKIGPGAKVSYNNKDEHAPS